MVFGTWTTLRRPPACDARRIAEKAVSSPPMVISLSMPSCRSALVAASR